MYVLLAYALVGKYVALVQGVSAHAGKALSTWNELSSQVDGVLFHDVICLKDFDIGQLP